MMEPAKTASGNSVRAAGRKRPVSVGVALLVLLFVGAAAWAWVKRESFRLKTTAIAVTVGSADPLNAFRDVMNKAKRGEIVGNEDWAASASVIEAYFARETSRENRIKSYASLRISWAETAPLDLSLKLYRRLLESEKNRDLRGMVEVQIDRIESRIEGKGDSGTK